MLLTKKPQLFNDVWRTIVRIKTNFSVKNKLITNMKTLQLVARKWIRDRALEATSRKLVDYEPSLISGKVRQASQKKKWKKWPQRVLRNSVSEVHHFSRRKAGTTHSLGNSGHNKLNWGMNR